MKLRLFSSIVLFVLIANIAVAQKEPFKFGKLDEADLLLDSCNFYPEAHSMILGEYGDLRFRYYDHTDTWEYVIEILSRKKIFNKADKDAGNITIKLYSPLHGSGEEISAIKGIVYNYKDGKIVETKLKNEDKFENRLNNYWKEVTIAMPDVQEGSVIDFTYTITSSFVYNLRTWQFQYDIPVRYSELRVLLPEFFKYQISNVGSVVPIQNEERTRDEEFKYSGKTLPQAGGRVEKYQGSLPSQSLYKRYVAENILPVIKEPFMNNKVDLPNRIEFQLMYLKFPNSPMQNIAGTYERFNDELRTREDFGVRLNKGAFAKDKIDALSGEDELTKASELHSWINSHFTFDGYSGFLSDHAGRNAFNKAKGNVPDINLTLLAAYKEAGIEAHPVLLSTRGHGIAHPVNPSYEDFNYVVALIKIGSSYYFADASSNMPFGMLPEQCLNGKGWIYNENGGSWIDLKTSSNHAISTNIITTFSDNNIINEVSLKEEAYAAYDLLEELEKNGIEKHQQKLNTAFSEWELSQYQIDKENPSEGITTKFLLKKELDDTDIIYLNPLVYGAINENPFNREKRYSNIDFPYGLNKLVINKITLPEGYTAELPTPGIIRMPNNAGSFTYNVTMMGNTINVISNFKLSKKDFSPEEYASLKQFYQLMIEKNQSPIVIKRL